MREKLMARRALLGQNWWLEDMLFSFASSTDGLAAETSVEAGLGDDAAAAMSAVSKVRRLIKRSWYSWVGIVQWSVWRFAEDRRCTLGLFGQPSRHGELSRLRDTVVDHLLGTAIADSLLCNGSANASGGSGDEGPNAS